MKTKNISHKLQATSYLPVIFILGNPLEPQDRGAVNLFVYLQSAFPDISFVHYDPTEELPDKSYDHLILIDVILGITDVTVYTSLSDFALSPRVSVHDYDLTMHLSILQKLGRVKKLTIIGVPEDTDNDVVKEKIAAIIRQIVSEKV